MTKVVFSLPTSTLLAGNGCMMRVGCVRVRNMGSASLNALQIPHDKRESNYNVLYDLSLGPLTWGEVGENGEMHCYSMQVKGRL